MVGVNLRPHDLRRHAATHGSRSGTPIEIVSKIILRHAHLSTTQRYLEKVTAGFADLIGGEYPTYPWDLGRPFRNMSVDHLLNSDPGHSAGRTFRLRA